MSQATEPRGRRWSWGWPQGPGDGGPGIWPRSGKRRSLGGVNPGQRAQVQLVEEEEGATLNQDQQEEEEL